MDKSTHVSLGFPQGSILSLFLLLDYINDLSKRLSLNAYLFGDNNRW